MDISELKENTNVNTLLTSERQSLLELARRGVELAEMIAAQDADGLDRGAFISDKAHALLERSREL